VTGINGDRYEFWIYRQIRKRLDAGEWYVNDSLRHRSLHAELIQMDEQAHAIQALDIPWLREPVDAVLDNLFAELDRLWQTFDRELRQGKLKHLAYDPVKKNTSLAQTQGRQRRSTARGVLCKAPRPCHCRHLAVCE
jgi:hypothetical protein